MRATLFLLLLLLPSGAGAQNAGIVQGLWFDREAFFADQPVRIYVAVRNNTGGDLSGTVEFYVDNERIERNNIDALDGRIIESWADWTPSYGTSTITATLSRTEMSSTASGTQAIEVTSALAEEVIFIDRDTDDDGVGDQTDTDDDGDGITDDEDERPLQFDETAVAKSAAEESTETEVVTEAETSETRDTTSGPQGLEQYLTESRADSAFASITNTINTTKERLDEYRIERSQSSEVSEPAAPLASSTDNVQTNESGFGTVTRNQTEQVASDGWLTIIWQVLAGAFGAGYTLILSILSFILGYPSLLQFALLILLLFIIIRIAKKIGSRPG